MSYSQTFISHAEEIVDDVAQWGVDYVNRVIEVLAPDGRPFGMERRSRRDQVRDYVQNVRGKEDVWRLRVEDTANRIVTLLKEAGVKDDDIASVHPYSIALKLQFQYSSTMERYLAKEEARAREETLSPLPPIDIEDEDGISGSGGEQF